jgi:predicted alpha/beta superfamily hydrolase
MTTEIAKPFAITLRDAATRRLDNVERHSIAFNNAAFEVFVALPVSYRKKTKQQYPLLLIHDARDFAGSAIEMSRLMAQTKEIRQTIVVGIDASVNALGGLPGLAHFLSQALLPWCGSHLRAAPGEQILFGRGLESVTQAMPIPVRVLQADAPVSSLLLSLRELYATGHRYGNEILGLTRGWVAATLSLLAPALRLFWRKPPIAPEPDNPYRTHSEVMDRDYEVFVNMPSSWTAGSLRRYPALVVLDANIEYSTVAESVARLAARNQIDEMIVIGVGTPRSAGPFEFGFRRFEEFSPPAEAYAYDDELGTFFRSFFSIRGQDARARMGRAPQLFAFLTRELLPKLARKFPIDTDNLGLLGHSAAGTFVGYALCQENSPFRRYIGVSPGIAISGNWLLKEGRSIAQRADAVHLSIGGEEKKNRFNQIAGIPATEAFAARLRQHARMSTHYSCFDGETHSSIFPRAVNEALHLLYGGAAVVQLAAK